MNKPILVTGHLHTKDGEMGQAYLLGPAFLFGHKVNNQYIFKIDNILCTGIMNYYVCQYYIDDKYGIVGENDENYTIYKSYLEDK